MDTHITLHKDKTQSFFIDVDMEKFVHVFQDLAKDSTNKENPLTKYPRQWTSLYDFDLKEGKKLPKDEDSIRFMKRTFLKGNFNQNKFKGISIKMYRLNEKDAELFTKNLNDKEKSDFKNLSNDFKWDGKTLKLSTKNWQITEQEKEISKILDLKMKFNFEEPIKTIKGKHDWVKQTDKKTIEVNFDFATPDKKLKHNDRTIIITTQ